MKKILFLCFYVLFFCEFGFSQHLDYSNESESQAKLDSWTEERMANAIPSALLQIGEQSTESQQKHDASAKAETEMLLSDEENETLKPFFTSIADINRDPYKKAGKLFFSMGGKDYSCTAQLVGLNTLLTAAHCLKGLDGEWAREVVFHRASSNGRAAQLLDVYCKDVPDDWTLANVSDIDRVQWDYGFAKTRSSSNVGSLNMSTYLPKFLKAIGYSKHYRQGRYLLKDYGTRGIYKNGRYQMRGNDLIDGASGGAWFAHDGNTVVGLNSGIDPQGMMWGPDFNKSTFALYKRMKQRCSYR